MNLNINLSLRAGHAAANMSANAPAAQTYRAPRPRAVPAEMPRAPLDGTQPDRYFRGRDFRSTCAGSALLPAAAVAIPVAAASSLAIFCGTFAASAVVTPACGVVGAGLGAVIGTVFALSPLTGGASGYRQASQITDSAIQYVAVVITLALMLLTAGFILSAGALGYSVGFLLTSPLFLLGKRSAVPSAAVPAMPLA